MLNEYFIGLDLGQAADYTAVAIVERQLRRPSHAGEATYALRHLQRFALGTAYTEIVPAVTELTGRPPLAGHVTLVVDQTGIGRAVVDMLRRQAVCSIVPVTITAGDSVTEGGDGSRRVPKKELVTCLQLLLQGRRLRMSRAIPECATLVRELENFRVRITAAAHETFGAGSEAHDDLVVAVALACWWAERGGYGPFEVTADPSSRSILADLPEGVFMADDEKPWRY